MAIKRFTAIVTGTHALSGIYIEEGKEYNIEESLAGPEAFSLVIPTQDGMATKKKKEVKDG